ncbi:RNA-directed DNA polymerase, eukaryota, Reverse transcriptase zinc-binding domain protein [Artemisia annua]|uniref:RNA-directed DNA polymerase, eukaryota, Reverse transcriptase zinc-binding domain protein n=1 Tax=Artemisia annua TaxID=35608 RepID=A0A2U1MLR3_ARTAN|nr:RNA-directed DNA polymerase, eukaryota, Reverse transcriptase zinc-binding domain protein [Artemisia annua]
MVAGSSSKVPGPSEVDISGEGRVPLSANVSWGWRKLLQIRNLIRPHVWYKIGNGCNASVWYDTWNVYCPLMNYVTYRALSNAGFSRHEKVADVMNDGAWTWPESWYTTFPMLGNVTAPTLFRDQADTVHWKVDGSLVDFAVKHVWQAVRTRGYIRYECITDSCLKGSTSWRYSRIC